MCLSRITHTYKPPKKEDGEGYKVVLLSETNGVSSIAGIFFPRDRLPKNTWGNAVQMEITGYGVGTRVDYTSGYHVFKNLDDADCLFDYACNTFVSDNDGFVALVRVKYRAVLAEGFGVRPDPPTIGEHVPVDEDIYTEEVVAAEMYWDGNILKRQD
jgi:hypothetical protein